MWRRNNFKFGNLAGDNQDSDRSISEEEEGDKTGNAISFDGLRDNNDDLAEEEEGDKTGNAISFDGLRDNKGSMQVMSQLEMFRDSYELHSTGKGSISSQRIKEGYHMDDELEFSSSDELAGSSHPRTGSATYTKPNEGMICLPTMASISDEILSDDQKTNPPTLRSGRDDVDSTWSEASREVEALVCLNENSSCPSSRGVFAKEKKSLKVGGKKLKPKFAFRLPSHKEDQYMVVGGGHTSTSVNSPPSDEIDAAVDDGIDEFTAEHSLILHDKESEQPENYTAPFELAHKHEFKEHSMAEFLYSFEESTSNRLKGCSDLDDRNQGEGEDEDDPVEALDNGSPFLSDDDAENHQNLMLLIPGKTMADQFHEAFGTVAVIDEMPNTTFPRPLCNGMYGMLQQIMQSEKKRDADYLKSISAGTGFKDEKMCIFVKILTRSLEAKLVVCSCTLIEDGKNLHTYGNLQMKVRGVARTLTIIFNPRICSDVELEAGNLICIHPPWKDVQVKGKDDGIYLCSYFTQIQP